jgi:hypothetical protein
MKPNGGFETIADTRNGHRESDLPAWNKGAQAPPGSG